MADVRAALEFWGFKTSDLSDEQADKLYWQEWGRRWKALSGAARTAGKSIAQLARSFKAMHRTLKAAHLTQP